VGVCLGHHIKNLHTPAAAREVPSSDAEGPHWLPAAVSACPCCWWPRTPGRYAATPSPPEARGIPPRTLLEA